MPRPPAAAEDDGGRVTRSSRRSAPTLPESGEPGLLSETVGAVESMLTVIEELGERVPGKVGDDDAQVVRDVLGSEVTSHVVENGELESLHDVPEAAAAGHAPAR